VVVLRALGLGDLLTAFPALRAVREAFPHARTTLLMRPDLGALAVYAGCADRVVPLDRLAPLPQAVTGADVMVNLHGRGPESHMVLLAAHPRRLIAFANQAAGVDGPAWKPHEHEVHRWCRLLAESGIPAAPDRLELSPPPLPASLGGAAGATLIHPGAASESRRWPVERWAAVACAEIGRGHRVILTGTAAEWRRCHAIVSAANLEPRDCLAGRTSLLELAALVGVAGLVLTGDTGVAHLATAVGRPSVVLFGPVPPSEWGPPPDRPWHVALWAGQYGDPQGGCVDPGLLDITVPDVVTATERAREAVNSV
jgi:ADP-heptose:LPS heptosyltransferase